MDTTSYKISLAVFIYFKSETYNLVIPTILKQQQNEPRELQMHDVLGECFTCRLLLNTKTLKL